MVPAQAEPRTVMVRSLFVFRRFFILFGIEYKITIWQNMARLLNHHRKKQMMLLILIWLYLNWQQKRLWLHPILKRLETAGKNLMTFCLQLQQSLPQNLQQTSMISEFHQLIREFHLERVSSNRRYFRMLPKNFEKLLSFIRPLITKTNTHLQKPIGPAECLAVMLRSIEI